LRLRLISEFDLTTSEQLSDRFSALENNGPGAGPSLAA